MLLQGKMSAILAMFSWGFRAVFLFPPQGLLTTTVLPPEEQDRLPPPLPTTATDPPRGWGRSGGPRRESTSTGPRKFAERVEGEKESLFLNAFLDDRHSCGQPPRPRPEVFKYDTCSPQPSLNPSRIQKKRNIDGLKVTVQPEVPNAKLMPIMRAEVRGGTLTAHKKVPICHSKLPIMNGPIEGLQPNVLTNNRRQQSAPEVANSASHFSADGLKRRKHTKSRPSFLYETNLQKNSKHNNGCHHPNFPHGFSSSALPFVTSVLRCHSA